MYTLVYHYRETVDNRRNEYKKYNDSAQFRLRRNALHYLDKVQNDYWEDGYEIGGIEDGINCYKSVKIEEGGQKIIEITIKVEKVGR